MRQRLGLLVLVFAVILAGCGGEGVEAPTGLTTPKGEIFQIALPRIVVDVDADGAPTVLGISPGLLSAVGVDVSGFSLPKDLVDQLTGAGVQHIEVASVGDRLMFFVDGQPLPHLGWSQDSLSRVLDVLDALEVPNASTIRTVLPIVTRFGLDVVLRLPRSPDVAEIPFVDTRTVRSFTPTVTTEPPSAIIKFELRYDDQGEAGIMGLSPADLAALGVGGIGRMSPELLTNFQENGIQHLEIRTKPDGAYVYVNNEPLPKLIWDTQLLANMVDLVARLMPDTEMLPLIQQIAPYLDRADLGVLLRVPLAAGATEIPAELH